MSENINLRRIACIGSSVTKGTGLADPATESYPAQLAAFLQANGYPAADVRNFGEGGAGVLKRGCNPFWDTEQFGDALAFDADVVIILLGTNDSREEFWGNDFSKLLHAKEQIIADFAAEEEAAAIVHGEIEFEQDLEEFVEIFGSMPAEPQIFLCTPAPLFDSSGWLKQEVLRTEIVPRIRRVAANQGLRVVELFDSSLVERPELFPDGLHPSAAGAAEIAALIGNALLEEAARQEDDLEEVHKTASQAVESRVDHEDVTVVRDKSTDDLDEKRLMEEERQIVMRELQKMSTAQRF